MSISDGLDLYTFRRKMEKARSGKEEMNGKVFTSRQIRHISFVFIMIKVLSLLCTLTWRVNNFVSRQEKCINRRNENTKKRDS